MFYFSANVNFLRKRNLFPKFGKFNYFTCLKQLKFAPLNKHIYDVTEELSKKPSKVTTSAPKPLEVDPLESLMSYDDYPSDQTYVTTTSPEVTSPTTIQSQGNNASFVTQQWLDSGFLTLSLAQKRKYTSSMTSHRRDAFMIVTSQSTSVQVIHQATTTASCSVSSAARWCCWGVFVKHFWLFFFYNRHCFVFFRRGRYSNGGSRVLNSSGWNIVGGLFQVGETCNLKLLS